MTKEERIFKCSKCERPCFTIGLLFPEGCLYKNLEGKWEEVSKEYTFITKEIYQTAVDVKSEWKKYMKAENLLPHQEFLDKLNDLLENILKKKKKKIDFPNLRPPECDWQHPTDMHY